METSADDQESVISSAVTKNDKLGDSALVFYGTSDNDLSVSLGVEQYFNFSGSVLCVCHTLELGVNDSVSNGPFFLFSDSNQQYQYLLQ